MFFTHVCKSKLMGATTANVRAIIFISYSTLRGRHNHTIYSKTQKKNKTFLTTQYKNYNRVSTTSISEKQAIR